MKRGDLVTVAFSGDYGKPRPALVIQSDGFDDLASVTVLPLTSHLLDTRRTRILVLPTKENGLRSPSSIMIEKIGSLARRKVGPVIGSLSTDDMAAVNRALAIFLGIV
ncbi:type II toxin-antitoxin system PemK/MazF family toxin [Rhodopseudomonas palustris]|uniref:Type II toxin-antitoxin system PemK/MazF family toxin n=1 Tax=Rhodopseudomonas palustris (strain ATCC BAA-98 / CGA009) TaxID=258594 RepID=Q6NB87_RHOPA|nr:type II toxin-antitoxin system PemK/MazF family toxin [Rhodopseudomonas palustris]ACE99567.1 transcriptional modulator of MazE/toxin, MazF [Rhodopseudomonas palustris TIE-1]OPF91764.1 growth inhibitor PemK [Rhodopseudomonas palustris]PPQ44640.1 type II toxin-antitoxin system PemK/MazF family toxin [Rhodopseudomonas palustris]QLH70126.1 type II toxin-antitoxin system PemK/MazF family toxin [Rhodopseudomonas palustris]QQM02435.1 putative endoribonuclease MazF [Rhodopseudomonas palustris]